MKSRCFPYDKIGNPNDADCFFIRPSRIYAPLRAKTTKTCRTDICPLLDTGTHDVQKVGLRRDGGDKRSKRSSPGCDGTRLRGKRFSELFSVATLDLPETPTQEGLVTVVSPAETSIVKTQPVLGNASARPGKAKNTIGFRTKRGRDPRSSVMASSADRAADAVRNSHRRRVMTTSSCGWRVHTRTWMCSPRRTIVVGSGHDECDGARRKHERENRTTVRS